MIETRIYWMEKRGLLEKEASANRNSQSVAFGLLDVYDELTEDQRDDVNTILAEWLASDDNGLRYDAQFLISQRCIKSMTGAVEGSLALAERRPGVEANYEAKKLQRILDELK